MVRVQPGVTLAQLNDRLARDGRRFAPDPASGQVCTIGGMLANNASGARALIHGYTRDHVAGLRVVLDTGETADAGTVELPSVAIWRRPTGTTSSARCLLARGAGTAASATISRTRAFNRCGYLLEGVLSRREHRLAASARRVRGHLGLFTEATLRPCRFRAAGRWSSWVSRLWTWPCRPPRKRRRPSPRRAI